MERPSTLAAAGGAVPGEGKSGHEQRAAEGDQGPADAHTARPRPAPPGPARTGELRNGGRNVDVGKKVWQHLAGRDACFGREEVGGQQRPRQQGVKMDLCFALPHQGRGS